jgi:hypothetical protein
MFLANQEHLGGSDVTLRSQGLTPTRQHFFKSYRHHGLDPGYIDTFSMTLALCLGHNDIRVIHRRHCERSAAIQIMGDQSTVAIFCLVSWVAASLTLLAMTMQ